MTNTETHATVNGIYADAASYVPCGKCGGTGTYTAKTSGKDYDCSACGTSGRNLTREAKKAIKAIREAAAAAGRATLAPWIKSLRDAASTLPALPDYREFGSEREDEYHDAIDALSFEDKRAAETRHMLESIADSAYTRGTVTDKQRAAADRILAKLAAPAAVKVPVPTGKIAITGVIVSTKSVEGDYGWTEKMLVEDDRGFRVWGTLPRKARVEVALDDPAPGWITDEDKQGNLHRYRSADKGDRIAFTATVERSRDDECFGFYKRPSKIKMLPAVEAVAA